MYNWRACNISENPSLKTKTTWLTKKLINAHGMPCVKVSLKQSIAVYIILLWLWISMLIRILSMLIFVSALLKCIDAACLSSINNKFKLNIFSLDSNSDPDSDLLYVKIFSLTFLIATFYLNWLINNFSVKVFWSVDCLHPVIFMLQQNVCHIWIESYESSIVSGVIGKFNQFLQ